MMFGLYYVARRNGREAEVFAIESIHLPSVRAAVAHARHRFHHLITPVYSCLITWQKNGEFNYHTVKNTKEA